MSPALILYVIAFVCFLGGVLDHPRVSGVRCICAGVGAGYTGAGYQHTVDERK